MPFDFITEYLAFNSGNECARNYHIWSALVVLAATVHKRVWISQGYHSVYPNLYVGLIGDMGSRKSSAKDIACDLFQSTFPDYPMLTSVQSREDIIKYMASDKCAYSFKDASGTIIEVRPIVGFINELTNFLSIDPVKTVVFFTDIYSGKRFNCSTIKHGLQDLVNPCVNLLACETPDNITSKLKSNIISGGFARRIVYIYETTRSKPIAFPERPTEHQEMWARLKQHLLHIVTLSGEFSWTADARKFYTDYYENLMTTLPDDKIMAGYRSSKGDQLFKVAMGLALSEESPNLVMRQDLLERALAMLDVIEVNMPKLSMAAGRNELALPMQKAMEVLDTQLAPNQGWMALKTFKRILSKEMQPMEIDMVLKFMKDTDQIYVRQVTFNTLDGAKVVREMVMTAAKYAEEAKNGVITK